MGLGNWWKEAASKAEDFLGSGRYNETVLNAPLNYNTSSSNRTGGSGLAGGGGLSGGCTSSSQCPAGYACINGVCRYMDVGGGATGGSAASAGDCNGNDPLSPCNQSTPNSCQQSPNCGSDPQPRDCCGSRCCRFSAAGVQCFCGDCPPLPGCNDYCTNYRAANGEDADNCGGKSCDECSTCNNGECVPLGSSAPCHCGQDQPCPGDCMKCVTDPESSSLGECRLTPDDCKSCATIYNYRCPCNVVLPSVTACKPWGASGLTATDLAYAKAASMCQNSICPDPKNDPCAPQCQSRTFCTDTGTGVASCPEGWSQTGTLEAGGNRCVFCQKCSTDSLPESCKDCDCNCHDDCPPCQICNQSGQCVDDPKCKYGTWVFTGTQNNTGTGDNTTSVSASFRNGIPGDPNAPAATPGCEDGGCYPVTEGAPNALSNVFSPTGPQEPWSESVEVANVNSCSGSTFGCGMLLYDSSGQPVQSLLGSTFTYCSDTVTSPNEAGCYLRGSWSFVPD